MPNDLAACQVTPGSEWILAKVISYDQGMYTLSDEDVESDKSTYNDVFVVSFGKDFSYFTEF